MSIPTPAINVSQNDENYNVNDKGLRRSTRQRRKTKSFYDTYREEQAQSKNKRGSKTAKSTPASQGETHSKEDKLLL